MAFCFTATALQIPNRNPNSKPNQPAKLGGAEEMEGRVREPVLSRAGTPALGRRGASPSMLFRLSRAVAFALLLRSDHRCEAPCHAISHRAPGRLRAEECSIFPPKACATRRSLFLLSLAPVA